ncbi:MAG: hypothetical protein HYX76_14220 [Acidobacteria bacterium]|nr:hypothetical protein [Acidobacteriota bacterium]
MVTNCPHLTVAAPAMSRELPEARLSGLVNGLLLGIKQFICGLHGHDSMLHFEENRVMLRCSSCGWDSPGWEVGDRRPRPRFAGDARRHLLARRAPVLITRKTA